MPKTNPLTLRHSRRRASDRDYESQLGCARGELMLVEHAVARTAKELRRVADRLERLAGCTREAYERINSEREP